MSFFSRVRNLFGKTIEAARNVSRIVSGRPATPPVAPSPTPGPVSPPPGVEVHTAPAIGNPSKRTEAGSFRGTATTRLEALKYIAKAGLLRNGNWYVVKNASGEFDIYIGSTV